MRDRSNRSIRSFPFGLACLAYAVMVLAGCTAKDLADLQAGVDRGETVYSATTQATAAAKQKLATMPANTPGTASAQKVVAASETGEQTARLALDVATAALKAAQNQDPASPELQRSLTAVLSAIPSPYTPLLAGLIPLSIPVGFAIFQSFKLGHMKATVTNVTAQLEQHKAALAALGGSIETAAPAPPTAAATSTPPATGTVSG